jgi:hypothetical protein
MFEFASHESGLKRSPSFGQCATPYLDWASAQILLDSNATKASIRSNKPADRPVCLSAVSVCFGLDRRLSRGGGLVTRIGRAAQLNEQQVDLAVGNGSMFHALWDDVEVSRTQLDL